LGTHRIENFRGRKVLDLDDKAIAKLPKPLREASVSLLSQLLNVGQ
jgi:hypothetical protein